MRFKRLEALGVGEWSCLREAYLIPFLGGEPYKVEYRIVRPDGKQDWLEVAFILLDIRKDIVMPKMNGVALIRALKGWNPRLKFIMMSGYSEVSLQGLTEDSTTPFLAKPFAQSQLLHAIRSTLNASS